MFEIYASFALYLSGMLGIGFYFYKKNQSASDYILGSRKLPPGVAALSSGASDLSGWALMGLPGAIYAGGLGNIWIVIFTILGVYINWKVIAPRLRIQTIELNNSQTIPEYFANRFKEKSKIISLATSLVTLIFFVFYVAAGLSGGAVLFSTTFDLNYNLALIIGTIVIVTYTFMGGYLAVCWTDFFQGLLMALSLMIVAIFLIFIVDPSKILAMQFNNEDSFISLLKPSQGWLLGILSLSGWCLGYMGQPHVLVRFMSVRSQDEIKTSRRIAVIWSTITMISALTVGWLGIGYFEQPIENSETIFLALSQAIFHPFVAGLIIAGVLAAIMSTIDSQLLICSSTLSEDLYKKYIKPKASDKEILFVARISIVIISLIGLAFAFNGKNETLLSLIENAWGGFGAAFGPIILFSLVWKKMTANSAIVGMLTGTIVAIIWNHSSGGIFELFSVVPGFIFASLAIIVVTKIETAKNS